MLPWSSTKRTVVFFTTIGLVLAVFVVFVVGFAVAPFLGAYGPHAWPSRNINEAKARGIYAAPVSVSSKSIQTNGCALEFNEAWIERASLTKPLFFWMSSEVPNDYFFLCLTLANGHDCFEAAHLMLALKDGGGSFGNYGGEVFAQKLLSIPKGEQNVYVVTAGSVRASFKIPDISMELFGAQRELAAQETLLRLAQRLNWTQEELAAINRARDYYSQLVQRFTR